MTNEQKLEAIGRVIADSAKRKVTSDADDFCVEDYCGGNVDDAYQMGERDGYTILAQIIQAILQQPNE